MLDAFIIEEIRKEEEAKRRERRQQPYLPVPARMPYEPLKRGENEDKPERGYWDSGRGDSRGRDIWDGCTIDMKSDCSQQGNYML